MFCLTFRASKIDEFFDELAKIRRYKLASYDLLVLIRVPSCLSSQS